MILIVLTNRKLDAVLALNFPDVLSTYVPPPSEDAFTYWRSKLVCTGRTSGVPVKVFSSCLKYDTWVREHSTDVSYDDLTRSWSSSDSQSMTSVGGNVRMPPIRNCPCPGTRQVWFKKTFFLPKTERSRLHLASKFISPTPPSVFLLGNFPFPFASRVTANLSYPPAVGWSTYTLRSIVIHVIDRRRIDTPVSQICEMTVFIN